MARSKSKAKKKTKKYWIIPFAIVFALAAYSIFTYYYRQQQEHEAQFTMYPGFGIEIPEGYRIHGIDVSSYQQYIYWPSVKQMRENDVEVSFAFIKATEGLSNTDRFFKRNWQNAHDAGITCGAYHFFIASKSGEAQAANFIKTVKLGKGDLPPVVDIEDLYRVSPEMMQQRLKAFLQAVETAYAVKPIIYTNASFYNNYLGDAFNSYPLWVAHYFEKKSPSVNRDWLFWQHSSTGKIDGIKANVDFNVFNGEDNDFENLLIK